MRDSMQRCDWAGSNSIYICYHDNEWGVPNHNDTVHYEFLLLESAQAGLSWITILKKRENYRQAFFEFNFEKIAGFDDKKKIDLLENPGIIRNRLKINSAVNNAKRFMEVRKEFNSFDNYIWSFTNGISIINRPEKMSDVPSKSNLSDTISLDLKKRGFSFMGSVIVYSYLQAVGIVNDHVKYCFKCP